MNEVLRQSVLSSAMVLALLGAFIAIIFFAHIFLGYPRPILPRGSLLSAKEQAIVAAVADALFPVGGPIPVSGTEAGLVAYMDTHMRRVPTSIRILLRLLLAFIEHGPWLFGPRRARFTRLRLEERAPALKDMEKSSLYLRRVSFFSIRTLLSMGYLANPAVVKSIGCAGHASPFEASLSCGAAAEPAGAAA